MSTRLEPRWPASLALVVCAGLYVPLSNRLVVGPRWLLPALVVLPLIPLSLRWRHAEGAKWARYLAISLVALITLTNVVSLILLINRVFYATNVIGRGLLYSAASIWATNVIVFGLWFWELDRGGPHIRAGGDARGPDLQFPQMAAATYDAQKWHPRFFDYLYTSFANGTSFAPADAMPLSGQMKALFGAEALISFTTIVIIAGEAVNILR
ncbi:MAG: hypothetical protein WCA31_06755 [Acidimicrobiales bacterium]